MANDSNDLETIKEILMATARRASAADERISQLAQRTDERINRLAERQERTQEQLDTLGERLDALREDVDIAFQTIGLMAQNTDREMAQFRSAILGIQEENRRIWEYLLGQQRNGNGNEPQP